MRNILIHAHNYSKQMYIIQGSEFRKQLSTRRRWVKMASLNFCLSYETQERIKIQSKKIFYRKNYNAINLYKILKLIFL